MKIFFTIALKSIFATLKIRYRNDLPTLVFCEGLFSQTFANGNFKNKTLAEFSDFTVHISFNQNRLCFNGPFSKRKVFVAI